MTSWLPIEGWRDLLDIALVAGFAWVGIRYLRHTRARAAIAGLALLGGIYFLARGLDLRLAEAILQGFFAVLVLVLVVVFQDELRRLFEQLGSWRRGAAQLPPGSETLDLLVRTVARLASARTGALIVLPGREPLDRHLEGGVRLGGRVSEPLLLSIFDASSPGHDGAVLLRGSSVERFAVHLPLSANHQVLGPGGTRHAAALGLAERCDATCVVVSEERGTVSLARDGAIHVLRRPEDLVTELRETFDGPQGAAQPWWRARSVLDAAGATLLAFAVWMVFVPGSDLSEVTLEAQVEINNLPRDLELAAIEPEAVEVTLRGLRRDLLLTEPNEVGVEIDAYLARLGRRTFQVTPETVRRPDGLSVVTVEPARVRISLEPAPSPAPAPGPEPGAAGGS